MLDLLFEDRVVLVTGGAGRIGEACAIAFGDFGTAVIAADTNSLMARGLAAYNAAKAGVLALTRTGALDHATDEDPYAPVSLGSIKTAMAYDAPPRFAERVRPEFPFGRMGTSVRSRAWSAHSPPTPTPRSRAATTFDGGLLKARTLPVRTS